MTPQIRRWQVLSTLGIAVLAAVSTLLGLLRPDHYTDAPELLARIQAEAAVVLLVGVPVLLAGLWLAIHGSTRGRVVWLGALAYMTYIWATVAVSRAFNEFFLGYVLLFALSWLTLVVGLSSLDAGALRARLEGRISRPLFAGFLAFAAVGLGFIWLVDVIPAFLAGTRPSVVQAFGPTAIVTYVVDLGVVVPALLAAAYLLARGHEWGYAATGVLLVFAAVLAPGIAAITAVDLGAGVEMSLPVVVGSVVPPLVAAAFAVRYLLAIPRDAPPAATERRSAAD